MNKKRKEKTPLFLPFSNQNDHDCLSVRKKTISFFSTAVVGSKCLCKFHFENTTSMFFSKAFIVSFWVSQLKSDSDTTSSSVCIPWPRSRKWLLIFRTGLCSNTFHWFTYFICNFYFNLAEFETLLYYVSKILFSHRCDFGFKYNCICKHHKDLSSVCLCVDLTTFSDLGSTRRRWWGAWALIHKLSLKKSLLRFALSLKAVCTHPIPQKVEKLRLNLCKPMLLPIYTFLSSCLHQQSKNGNFNTMQCSATLCKNLSREQLLHMLVSNALNDPGHSALMSCIQSIERYWR